MKMLKRIRKRYLLNFYCYTLNSVALMQKKSDISRSFSVGVPGFEPGTPWSQTRCANRTALHPDNYCSSLINV